MRFPIQNQKRKSWELIDPISYPKTSLQGFTSLTLSREMGPLIDLSRSFNRKLCFKKCIRLCHYSLMKMRGQEICLKMMIRIKIQSESDGEHGNQASLSLMGSLRQAMLALTVIFFD